MFGERTVGRGKPADRDRSSAAGRRTGALDGDEGPVISAYRSRSFNRADGNGSPRMDTPVPTDTADRPRVLPLIRATHNQLEVDFLPPYGDPEVSIPGEFLTYLVVGGIVVEVLERVRR